MDYLELRIQCDPEFSEILMAELSVLPFESFLEDPPQLTGYITEDDLDRSLLKEILNKYESSISGFELLKVKRQNWNEEWEKNYEPIIVDDTVAVVASFHEIKKDYSHVLIIDPKMSFGTGHHETTHQMISNMLTMELERMKVLDAGCGTGVLAILADKMGASSVLGIDIDEWAVENARDNAEINNCHSIEIRKGTVTDLSQKFDIILANINKNVLLEEAQKYSQLLEKGGHLLLSGFYTHDQDDLIGCFEKLSLKFVSSSSRNEWASMLFLNTKT